MHDNTSQNGQKNDLQPKQSNILKILVKIWFVGPKNSNMGKKLFSSKHHRIGRKMICYKESRNFCNFLLKFGVLDIQNFLNLETTFLLQSSQNGQKNDLLPKKSKFLKNVAKIWGVGHRKFPKSDQNFFAHNIIEWAEK